GRLSVISRNQSLTHCRVQIEIAKAGADDICRYDGSGTGSAGSKRWTFGKLTVTICIGPGYDIKRGSGRSEDERIQADSPPRRGPGPTERKSTADIEATAAIF